MLFIATAMNYLTTNCLKTVLGLFDWMKSLKELYVLVKSKWFATFTIYTCFIEEISSGYF